MGQASPLDCLAGCAVVAVGTDLDLREGQGRQFGAWAVVCPVAGRSMGQICLPKDQLGAAPLDAGPGDREIELETPVLAEWRAGELSGPRVPRSTERLSSRRGEWGEIQSLIP